MGGSISADIEGRTWKQFSDGVVKKTWLIFPGPEINFDRGLYTPSARLDLWANLNDRFFFFLNRETLAIIFLWFVIFEHTRIFSVTNTLTLLCYFYDVIGLYSHDFILFISSLLFNTESKHWSIFWMNNRYFQILLEES